MTKAVLLVFALCISIPAFAQPLADTTSLDSLRSVVKQLQVQWQKQWRASDSLRITSILTRLRADSITRSIKTTEKAIADAQRRREAELQREAQRHLSEQDAADSIVPVSESAIESAQEQRDTSPPNQFPEQQGIEKPVDDGADGESNAATADDAADAATAEILQTLALQSAARTAAQKLQAGKPKRGETLSDSLTYHVLTMKPDTGIASYYASEFHGKRSSNGEVFNMNSLTCAHRWLPFGTMVLVTNLDNGKSVVVKVTDRGPFKHGRILDVSKKAATLLGMIKSGTARVCIQVSQPSPELEDSTRIDAPEADSTTSP